MITTDKDNGQDICVSCGSRENVEPYKMPEGYWILLCEKCAKDPIWNNYVKKLERKKRMEKYFVLVDEELGAFILHRYKTAENVAKVTKPVMWDRKGKVNCDSYSLIDWAKKAHEEIDEAFEAGVKAECCRQLGNKKLMEHYDTQENMELFDSLAVTISRLASKNILPGSDEWNAYVKATDAKNDTRDALYKHHIIQGEKKDD